MSTHRFTNLHSVVDEVHALFDVWSDTATLQPPLNCDGEIVLRLAVHEWIANLVQHAAFQDSSIEICLEVRVQEEVVEVSIEDTSQGFDLLGQLEEQSMLLNAPAPSERGRGLLMLITCTESLAYRPASEGCQKLSFTLRNPDDAIFAGLFHSEPSDDDAFHPAREYADSLSSGAGLPSLPLTPQPPSR